MMDDDDGNREKYINWETPAPFGPDMCPDTLKRTMFGLFGDKKGTPPEML
jgi:hypothetical protein